MEMNRAFWLKNALESIIIDFYCGSIKIFKQSNFMFLIILYLYNLYVYRCFNNQFIILVDFLDPNIQYRKRAGCSKNKYSSRS